MFTNLAPFSVFGFILLVSGGGLRVVLPPGHAWNRWIAKPRLAIDWLAPVPAVVCISSHILYNLRGSDSRTERPQRRV